MVYNTIIYYISAIFNPCFKYIDCAKSTKSVFAFVHPTTKKLNKKG